MRNKKLLLFLAVFLAIPAIFFAYRGISDMNSRAMISDELSAEPLKEYYAGRYALKVPEGLKLTAYTFRVMPDEPYDGLQSTESIKIIEIPWSTDDHDAEFEQMYAKPRAKKDSHFIKNNTPDDGGTYYAENMNAYSNFGVKSVCIAYYNGGGETPIETFISLPQGVVNFKEYRLYLKTPTCTDIERPAKNIFDHYRWGKAEKSDKNVFFTAYGYLVNYNSASERVTLSFKHQDDFAISYRTSGSNVAYQGPDADDPVPTISYIKKEMSKLGIQVTVLRERSFERGGVTFNERMLRFTSHKETADEYVFTLTANYEEKLIPPKNPEVDIEMEGKWSTVEQAVPYWNSIVANVRPVSVILDGKGAGHDR